MMIGNIQQQQYMHIYIYIYMERERERERSEHLHTHTYTSQLHHTCHSQFSILNANALTHFFAGAIFSPSTHCVDVHSVCEVGFDTHSLHSSSRLVQVSAHRVSCRRAPLRYFPAPVIVPPVPIPATRCAIVPPQSFHISGPVHV